MEHFQSGMKKVHLVIPDSTKLTVGDRSHTEVLMGRFISTGTAILKSDTIELQSETMASQGHRYNTLHAGIHFDKLAGYKEYKILYISQG